MANLSKHPLARKADEFHLPKSRGGGGMNCGAAFSSWWLKSWASIFSTTNLYWRTNNWNKFASQASLGWKRHRDLPVVVVIKVPYASLREWQVEWNLCYALIQSASELKTGLQFIFPEKDRYQFSLAKSVSQKIEKESLETTTLIKICATNSEKNSLTMLGRVLFSLRTKFKFERHAEVNADTECKLYYPFQSLWLRRA